MKDFFRSSTLELPKIIRSRYDREPSSLCLKHSDNYNNEREYDKSNVEKWHNRELQNKAWNRTDYIKKYTFSKFLDFFRLSAIITLYLLLFMRSFFVYFALLFFGTCSLYVSVFATDRCSGGGVDDITCPGFKINLINIDPVGTGNSIIGGTAAATSLLWKIASLLLFIIPIIAGISMIIAGYYYILSSGDSEKAIQAKTIIKWNLVAILVALFSYTIISLAAGFLWGSIK